MIKCDVITKRDFPSMSRVLWDFEQEFGPTERRYLSENGVTYGEPSAGAYVVPSVEIPKRK